MHALYRAVWERSLYRLELLSAEFFRELGRRFGEQASLTLICRGEHIVGFTFGLLDGCVYYNMYSGVDYGQNTEADLYFNLFYHSLDHALECGARTLHLGQTSDHFKSRLGTTQQPLYYYVRAVNPIVQWGLRAFSRYVLPPIPKVPNHHVFREE